MGIKKCPFISHGGEVQDCLETPCEMWRVFRCGHVEQNFMMDHIHRIHLHEETHGVLDFEVPETELLRFKYGVANLFLVEFFGEEDLDENGLIYGYDFVVDPDDPEIPWLLKSFSEKCVSSNKISWAEAFSDAVENWNADLQVGKVKDSTVNPLEDFLDE